MTEKNIQAVAKKDLIATSVYFKGKTPFDVINWLAETYFPHIPFDEPFGIYDDFFKHAEKVLEARTLIEKYELIDNFFDRILEIKNDSFLDIPLDENENREAEKLRSGEYSKTQPTAFDGKKKLEAERNALKKSILKILKSKDSKSETLQGLILATGSKISIIQSCLNDLSTFGLDGQKTYYDQSFDIYRLSKTKKALNQQIAFDEHAAGDYAGQTKNAEEKLKTDRHIVLRDRDWNDMLAGFFPGLKDLGEYEILNPAETLEILREIYPTANSFPFVDHNGETKSSGETPRDPVKFIRDGFAARRKEQSERHKELLTRFLSGNFEKTNDGKDVLLSRLHLADEQIAHYTRSIELIDEFIAQFQNEVQV